MQIVKIECQQYEGIEEYEFDGCAVCGWTPEGLYFKVHGQFNIEEVFKEFASGKSANEIDEAAKVLRTMLLSLEKARYKPDG